MAVVLDEVSFGDLVPFIRLANAKPTTKPTHVRTTVLSIRPESLRSTTELPRPPIVARHEILQRLEGGVAVDALQETTASVAMEVVPLEGVPVVGRRVVESLSQPVHVGHSVAVSAPIPVRYSAKQPCLFHLLNPCLRFPVTC